MSNVFLFDGVSKSFGPVRAADGVSLELRRGEFFSLLGPSGCGKTTLLRIAAGLEHPDRGRVLLDGKDVTALAPDKRQVNTIFQSYALFPHLSVWENIAFGLRMARRPRSEIRRDVAAMLALIQMEEHSRKRPDQLSGGQKQRVAVARALVRRPLVLLLDEPLAALDLKLRQHMLMELDRIHDEIGITFLYVTHDQSEAMSVSDRIAVMNAGRIEQIGAPPEIYEAPRTSFVAAFVGDTNFLAGTVAEVVDAEHSRFLVDGLPPLVCCNDKRFREGCRACVSLRPEKLRIARHRPVGDGCHNVLRATVEDIVYLGPQTKFWVRAGGHCVEVIRQHGRLQLDDEPVRCGEAIWITWHADDGAILEVDAPAHASEADARHELFGAGPPATTAATEGGA
ncbi:MAG: ABC transporter ATP-binding protein [Planctomycetota bacterium]